MEFLLISMGLMALGLTVYVLSRHDEHERIMRYSNSSKIVFATEKTDSIIEEAPIGLDTEEYLSYFN